MFFMGLILLLFVGLLVKSLIFDHGLLPVNGERSEAKYSKIMLHGTQASLGVFQEYDI